MVDAATAFAGENRTAGMHLRAELAGKREITEGELSGMNAHAVGLQHRARRLLIAHEVAMDFLAAENARPVSEHIVEKPGLRLELRHHLGAVGDIEMAAVLRLAIDVERTDQVAEEIERFAHLDMQPPGD